MRCDCGTETIYRDGVCGDCRSDAPFFPANARPIWTNEGPQTDRVDWKYASAVEAGHKATR